MIFDIARRSFSYLYRKFALSRAMLCLRDLKEYANNPQERKEEQLLAMRQLLHWFKACGLGKQEFIKVSYKRGYNFRRIMKILINS